MKKKIFVQSQNTTQRFPKYKKVLKAEKVIKPETPVIKRSCCGNSLLDND